MSDTASPKSGSGILTALAIVAGFLIFAVILLIVYVPKRPAPAGNGIDTPAQRADNLAELRAHEAAVSGSYAWVDKSKGVVRLPIDRAMELTLTDIQAAQQRQK